MSGLLLSWWENGMLYEWHRLDRGWYCWFLRFHCHCIMAIMPRLTNYGHKVCLARKPLSIFGVLHLWFNNKATDDTFYLPRPHSTYENNNLLRCSWKRFFSMSELMNKMYCIMATYYCVIVNISHSWFQLVVSSLNWLKWFLACYCAINSV